MLASVVGMGLPKHFPDWRGGGDRGRGAGSVEAWQRGALGHGSRGQWKCRSIGGVFGMIRFASF